MNFIDIEVVDRFIEDAVQQYTPECPQLVAYLENLYLRLQEGRPGVDLCELRFVGTLQEKGIWYRAPQARNAFHHFAHDVGISENFGAIIGDA